MNLDAALEEIGALLGDRLNRSGPDRAAHGRSETRFRDMPPDAVAYPNDTAEVSNLMKICARHRIPVVAWGAGTSIEGSALAPCGGISVDFSLMNRVLQVQPEDMTVVVQPGLTREGLNTELRHTGLFFPVDPGANASLGGMASTRASGTTTVRYGTMREQVLALEVVLADGRIIRTGSRARKSAAGYDLTHLFIGAEGTLGLITELTLKLHGQPECIAAATCAFDDMERAVGVAQAAIQMGLPVARIEFLDSESVAACNAYGGTAFPTCPHLFVEFHGSAAAVSADVDTFAEIVADMGGQGFAHAMGAQERAALWALRHNAYYAVLSLQPGARALVTDVCVPISRLAEAVADTRADIAGSGLQGPILGHVGDGNFHAILLVDLDSDSDMARAQEIGHRMGARALAMGGTITGEHGVGLGKLDQMAAEHGAAWDVMAQMKQALDPDSILNPGKVVRVARNRESDLDHSGRHSLS